MDTGLLAPCSYRFRLCVSEYKIGESYYVFKQHIFCSAENIYEAKNNSRNDNAPFSLFPPV